MVTLSAIDALADKVCNSRGDILPNCLASEGIAAIGADAMIYKAISAAYEQAPSVETAYAMLDYMRKHKDIFEAVRAEYLA